MTRIQKDIISAPLEIFHRSLERVVDRDLPRLSRAARVTLMKAVYVMASGETTQQQADGNNTRMMGLLARVYASIHPDSAYARHTSQRRHEFMESLLKDGWLRDLKREDWKRDISSRPFFLQHLAAAHNRAMSHGSLAFRACEVSYGHTEQKSEASYSKNEISFRDHWMSSDFGLLKGIRCLLHENTHAHQDQMGIAYKQGLLKPDSPFYQQGKLYAEFFRGREGESFYVEPAKGREAYRAHPLEREARMTERSFNVIARRLDLK